MAAPATPNTETEVLSLEEKFAGIASPDTREGYEGYIIAADKAEEVVKYIRDDLGYDYLSSVTGVDYLEDDHMEVVYHAFKTEGGPALNFKIQTDRENPRVPSITHLYPAAEFQEREAYDMYGILFDGHPDLRRILMWDDFEGWPMRKDWKEAYYEAETKPFKNRWPGGDVYRIEANNPFNKNVVYPEGFNLNGYNPLGDKTLYDMLNQYDRGGSNLKTDQIVVNIGPQHPSTHGVFRMVVRLDGENVNALKPVFGYLHRNHEKIGERNTWLMNMPYTDRLDYLTSMCNNHAYALTVEKMMGLEVPERADYIRVLMNELTRIASHLWATGFLLNDLGAFQTPMLYLIKNRELILDFFEATSGTRMMCNYSRFGGVAYDLPDTLRDENTMDWLHEMIHERLPRGLEELERFLSNNEIVRTRAIGLSPVTAQEAIALGMSGPMLRAAGVPYDVRRAEPYGIYDRFDFDIPVGTTGDVYDRYLVRVNEIRESIKILKQCLRDMPAKGDIMSVKPGYTHKVPAGEAYGRGENPKGELGFYCVSKGKGHPYRYHIRAPSFINLTGLEKLCVGTKIADVVVVLGSIDIVLGEVDR